MTDLACEHLRRRPRRLGGAERGPRGQPQAVDKQRLARAVTPDEDRPAPAERELDVASEPGELAQRGRAGRTCRCWCCDAACGDADPGDCQACSIAAGAAMNGVCGPRAPATCRPPVDACDAAEACDGVSLQCPADVPASDGTPCEGGLCESGLCTPQGDTSTTAPSITGETTSTTSSATAATTGETTPPALTTSDSTVSTVSNSGSGSGGDVPTTNAGTTLDAPTGDPQPDDTTGTTSAPPRGTDAGCGCRTAAPAPALALLLLALSRRRPRDPR